ncbi:MAG: BamA/TamA family outer membrane protein [Bacteroidetes bacterium]|nr:BamA/TamA family outer membrane protein [Bacteroidota bacterium]
MEKINLLKGARSLLAFCLCISLYSSVIAETSFHSPEGRDTLGKKRVSVLPVPAFGYSPETSTYIGAVGLVSINFYHDTLTRSSNAKAEFNYTWKKQYITSLGWEIFTKNEGFFLKGALVFSKYPDLYYGMGENTPDSYKTGFTSNRITGEINLLKATTGKRFCGPVIRYLKYARIDDLTYHPQLLPTLENDEIFGFGFRFLTDKRNSLLNPTRGRYTDLAITSNTWNHIPYYKINVDVRYYLTFHDNHTFAIRSLNLLSFHSPPFFDLSLLGGDNQVRGYYLGRYRDRNLFTLQGEYRAVLYRRWGYTVFGGLSKLNTEISAFDEKYLKPNYGLGLRFMIDRREKINLRFDYARGNKGSDGFYISFGEAF